MLKAGHECMDLVREQSLRRQENLNHTQKMGEIAKIMAGE